MDLATATPVEIDTELAKLDAEAFDLFDALGSTLDDLHRRAGDSKVRSGRSYRWSMRESEAITAVQAIAGSRDAFPHTVRAATNSLAAVEAAREAIKANAAAAYKLDAEYRRRPWTRAFLAITNGKGHVHTTQDCATCNNGLGRTQFDWRVEYSGAPQEQIVADAGERACTVCYPDAPVDTRNRPTKIFSADEITAAEARIQRAAKMAARDAQKLAKAITLDGSELRVPANGSHSSATFRTETAARNWVVAEIGGHSGFGYSLNQVGVDMITEALAIKHGVTIEAETADIEQRVTRWVKKSTREAEATRVRLGY